MYTLVHNKASAFLEAETLSAKSPQLITSHIAMAIPLCTMHKTYLTPNLVPVRDSKRFREKHGLIFSPIWGKLL